MLFNTKFLAQIWYFGYCVLYAYVILFKYKYDENKRVSTSEVLLYIWQFAFITEHVRAAMQLPPKKLIDRIKDFFTRCILCPNVNLGYNAFTYSMNPKLDILASTMSLAAFSLKWSNSTFPFAKLLMTLAIIPYYMGVC